MFQNMFGMIGNYEARKVGRDEFDWGFVSTCLVTDGAHLYETAVKHTDYRDDDMVIVEAYDTRAEAEAGHTKWVAAMTTEPLPDKLVDCCNAEVAQLLDAFSDAPLAYERKPKVIMEIAQERRRQVEREGWTPRHDDQEHADGELVDAAACYILWENDGFHEHLWPWDKAAFKPKDRRRDLVRAAALIVAEIERLDRRERQHRSKQPTP